MAAHSAPAVALTIAGSDCSAGAGIQADLKTFSAFDVYGLTAITCVVAETPGKVQSIQAVEPQVICEQITILLESFPVAAVKTGMLYSGEIIRQVADVLRDWNVRRGSAIPLVVDPVMVATSGDLLLQRDAIGIYESELFPLASVITPNLDEAATLAGEAIRDAAAMRVLGRQLADKYSVPILLKGGHLGGDTAVDLLFARDGAVDQFAAPFTRGVHTHGTGCTYSAAIAAALALGGSLEEAVARAKRFVTGAISRHFAWDGGGAEVLHALNHSARTP